MSDSKISPVPQVQDVAILVEHLNMQIKALTAILGVLAFTAFEQQRSAAHHLLDAMDLDHEPVLIKTPEMAESTRRTIKAVFDHYRKMFDGPPVVKT